MSSTMKNIHTPISYLVDVGWELPPDGESRLFIQANSLDVVNEFCRIVISQMTNHCDAVVDLIKKVDLATYINKQNADFKPKDQKEECTCYAHVVATVLHLAMHRIVGREGGIPDFKTIRDHLIDVYGTHGADTKKVLEDVCPAYRFRFRKVDERGARQAINERRPVVSRFSFSGQLGRNIFDFYKKTPTGILKKSDISGLLQNCDSGHAVVLTECAPDYLKYMNSWGQDFADGGFFRVEDQSVFSNTEFYDVYSTVEDLKPSEIEAYKEEAAKTARRLQQKFPSISSLPYDCPKCGKTSKVGEYSGHMLDAECPKCHQTFKPTNGEILNSICNERKHTHYV
jgi:hypothetical protein